LAKPATISARVRNDRVFIASRNVALARAELVRLRVQPGALAGVARLIVMIRKREWRAEALLIIALIGVYVLFITSYGNSVYDWRRCRLLRISSSDPASAFSGDALCFGARLLRFVFYPLLALSIFYMLARHINRAARPLSVRKRRA